MRGAVPLRGTPRHMGLRLEELNWGTGAAQSSCFSCRAGWGAVRTRGGQEGAIGLAEAVRVVSFWAFIIIAHSIGLVCTWGLCWDRCARGLRS